METNIVKHVLLGISTLSIPLSLYYYVRNRIAQNQAYNMRVNAVESVPLIVPEEELNEAVFKSFDEFSSSDQDAFNCGPSVLLPRKKTDLRSELQSWSIFSSRNKLTHIERPASNDMTYPMSISLD